MGLPLLLGATSSARTVAGSALAAAALPVMTLTLWLTHSSLAAPAAAIAIATLLVLAPDRLPKLATLLVAGAGSSLLFAAAEQRDALTRGLPTPDAAQQGDEMLAVVLVVCAGVALVQAGISLVARYGKRPAWTVPSRRITVVLSAVGIACAVVVALAAGVPGKLSDRWDAFTREGSGNQPTATRATFKEPGELFDPATSGRYKFWESAVDANASSPLVGIGPGTFEFWWAREHESGGFARDAHSTFLEVLGELGIIGLVLLGGFATAVLVVGAVRCLRAPPQLRLGLATATAACAVFTAAAVADWSWELGVVPVLYLMLAAVVVTAGAVVPRPLASPTGRDPLSLLRRYGPRSAIAALGVAAVIVIAIPLAGSVFLERSRTDAREGDLSGALEEARTAARLQPYAASPRLQEALVYEQMGDFDSAADAATLATEKEATNWRPWFILSRLEARRGDADAAVEAYHQARLLDPADLPKEIHPVP